MLGLRYDPPGDIFFFPVEVQVNAKRRGVRIGPPISSDNVDELESVVFPPRKLLGLVNSLYDPLGLMAPWYIKFKLLLRRITELPKKLDWDDIILEDLSDEWKELIKLTVALGQINFPRTVHPGQAVSGLMVLGFWDGSLSAWGCSIYC